MTKKEKSKPVKKKVYEKKENWKNNTGRPNKRETPEKLLQEALRYFDSISLTTQKYREENIPVSQKTEYQVVKTFFKYENPDEELEDDDEDIDTLSRKKKTRKRIRYKTIKIPIVNNLWEPIMETIRYEEPTVTWLARYLDTFRNVLMDYEWDTKFSNTVKRIKMLIEQKYEERLINWGWSWSIFALKNLWWKDQKDLSVKDITPSNKDSEELNEEELMASLIEIRKKKALANKK